MTITIHTEGPQSRAELLDLITVFFLMHRRAPRHIVLPQPTMLRLTEWLLQRNEEVKTTDQGLLIAGITLTCGEQFLME